MSSFIITVLAAILVLGLLVFVHELGHFLVAKAAGVQVLRFSLGFGPRLFGRQVGDTEYVLSAVPLGGYVKMLGEEPDEETEEASGTDPARAFGNQSLAKRFAIVLAGPGFNFLFAWICLFAIVAGWGMQRPAETALIGAVMSGMPAERAGILPDDEVIAVDGELVSDWDTLAGKIQGSEGSPVELRIMREGNSVILMVTPEHSVQKNLFGEEVGEAFQVGIVHGAVTEEVSLLAAPVHATSLLLRYSELIVLSVVKMLQGRISPKELGGPITIARFAGERARGGAKALLEFMAFLGVNLGILNLLPIPVLDGGHLLFLTTEAILRRPVQVRYREMAQQMGLFLLIGLMLFAVYNDITRWIQG